MEVALVSGHRAHERRHRAHRVHIAAVPARVTAYCEARKNPTPGRYLVWFGGLSSYGVRFGLWEVSQANAQRWSTNAAQNGLTRRH
jgi:hypothetical protein